MCSLPNINRRSNTYVMTLYYAQLILINKFNDTLEDLNWKVEGTWNLEIEISKSVRHQGGIKIERKLRRGWKIKNTWVTKCKLLVQLDHYPCKSSAPNHDMKKPQSSKACNGRKSIVLKQRQPLPWCGVGKNEWRFKDLEEGWEVKVKDTATEGADQCRSNRPLVSASVFFRTYLRAFCSATLTGSFSDLRCCTPICVSTSLFRALVPFSLRLLPYTSASAAPS